MLFLKKGKVQINDLNNLRKEVLTSSLWEQFKLDIISNNRYFAGKEVLTILDKLITIKMFPEGTWIDFYRARIGNYIDGDINSLLAPPNGQASAGRCNPEGISYLYLSSCQTTAISEIRPNSGDIVSIAKINVDVSNIFSFRVYFQNLNINTGLSSKEMQLIECIDSELSSKVTQIDKLKYIPLQYISEFIKNRGFDGFVYSSTVGPGMNLVIFNWEGKIDIVERNKIEVSRVNYNF